MNRRSLRNYVVFFENSLILKTFPLTNEKK